MNIQEQLMDGKDWIMSALNKGGDTHDFKDIVDGVLSGHMQLWMGSNGCAVTEIVAVSYTHLTLPTIYSV